MNFIFDLDGVLVDFKDIHKNAFIQAWNELNSTHHISPTFHSIHLEARSTKQKIVILTDYFGFVPKISDIMDRKQDITKQLLASASVYSKTKAALLWAYENGISISCCSNSIRSTVLTSLEKLVPLSIFKIILSNEDITHPKPHPEIYLEALKRLGICADQAIVFEDSKVGKDAAISAGIRVIDVVDALDITPGFLQTCLRTQIRPILSHINVVIPMAGLGSRFQKGGYSTPKPFLPIFGIPMFKWVIKNIVPESLLQYATIHIIVRSEHKSQFVELKNSDNIIIHTVDALTEGAACTVLTIKDHINTDSALVIANSDQYLEWAMDDFYRCLAHPDWDGVISTFVQEDPTDLRWSYATLNADGQVLRVEEKKFIGPLATTGIYGWKHGSDFVNDAEAMISSNIRVNNEFYVCPVYNININNGLKIRTHNCNKMWGLGVPVDYEYFLENFKNIPM